MKTLLISLIFITTFNILNSQTLGLSFGSVHVSDAALFQDRSLSKTPSNVFIKIGVGTKFKNNVTINLDYTLDIRQIQTTVFVPLFALKPKNDPCCYALNCK